MFARTTYRHSVSGRTFTADGGHRFGAGLTGVWDDGTQGVIFPHDILRNGQRFWVEVA